MYRPRIQRPAGPIKSKTGDCNPQPSFSSDCKNEPASRKIPDKPDEPISIEELTRAKSDIRGM